MTTKSPKRLHAKTIAEDRASLTALAGVPDYAPVNLAYSTASLQERDAALRNAEQVESAALRAFEDAREQTILAGHALHDGLNGAKEQLIAQFGSNSHVLHTVGLKKRSEYKSPARRPRDEAE